MVVLSESGLTPALRLSVVYQFFTREDNRKDRFGFTAHFRFGYSHSLKFAVNFCRSIPGQRNWGRGRQGPVSAGARLKLASPPSKCKGVVG
ncbi:hypothetical protein EDD64_12956 [Effusibacillus lacus]|nr:hypothetical protein EDD64_12956 [Effusibacillus lacus]